MSTEQIQEPIDNNQSVNADTQQFLTFILAGEEYGVDILRVQEIRGWEDATEIPNTPEYVKGVVNLRGTIVPIIDLRFRFELEQVEYSKTTVVIVMKIYGSSCERTMGFVVDAVSDVYNVDHEQQKPTPDFGCVVSTEFIKGLATVNEKMIILLDIDHVVDVDELDDTEKPETEH
jgi:purine-binding chemotaxis protein CheW